MCWTIASGGLYGPPKPKRERAQRNVANPHLATLQRCEPLSSDGHVLGLSRRGIQFLQSCGVESARTIGSLPNPLAQRRHAAKVREQPLDEHHGHGEWCVGHRVAMSSDRLKNLVFPSRSSARPDCIHFAREAGSTPARSTNPRKGLEGISSRNVAGLQVVRGDTLAIQFLPPLLQVGKEN